MWEINFYRRRKGANKINWIDVSDHGFGEADLSCFGALARFHIRRSDGILVQGGQALCRALETATSLQLAWLILLASRASLGN